MRRMLVLLVVLALAVPGAARASDGCAAVQDPHGDTASLAGDGPGLAEDVVSLEVGYDGAGVVAAVGLANLSAALDSAADSLDAYVNLTHRSTQYHLRATRHPRGWTFSGTRLTGGIIMRGDAVSIRGEADVAASVVSLYIELPASLPGEVVTARAGASSYRAYRVAGSAYYHRDRTDEAPDAELAPLRVALEPGACTVPAALAPLAPARCVVATDQAESSALGMADGADIVSLATEREGDVRRFSLTVTYLSGVGGPDLSPAGLNPLRAPEPARRWVFRWNDGAETHQVVAAAIEDKVSYTHRGAHGVVRTIAGALRAEESRIDLAVPASGPVRALEVETFVPDSAEPADVLVVGDVDDACPAFETPCPIVSDATGDVAPYEPGRPSALDILAIGARPHPAGVEVAVRVADLGSRSEPGPWRDAWVVSWWDGAGRRMAQAERTRTGSVAFTVDRSEGSARQVSPYSWSGVATTGELDLAANTVRIHVPLDPQEPEVWTGLGAVTYQVHDTLVVGGANPVDSSDLGTYRLGFDCTV